MFANTRGKRRVLGFASFVTTIALMACICTPAFSEEESAPAEQTQPTEQVQKAYTELSQLSIIAEQSTYDVISIRAQLDQTQQSIDDLNVQIQQGEEKLQRVRKDLSEFIAGDYKQGQQSLVDIMLSSSDFEEFITRVTYANKVVEHERLTIEQVDALMSELSQHRQALQQNKEALESMLEEQVVRVEAATVATSDVQEFIEQMPEEMYQQVMAYEQSVREENAEQSMEILQRIEQMAAESEPSADKYGADAQVSGQSTQQSASQSTSDAGESSQDDAGASTSYVGGSTTQTASDTSESQSSSSTSGTSSTSSSSSSDFMTRLYSLLGSGYQWSGYNWTGSTSDSSFTCSGVVDYALGRDSQSSSPETLYSEVGDNMVTDVSSLQEGDLVFYSYGGREVGHVGVYIGDGQVIDSIPNGGVAVRDVEYMDVVGGGSLS
ncbi:MAG: NlpC/P60 family protein [Coriobacteriales bacterium]|nr:NlpC/P60 family protein [Coriobacteriales bacterium]